MGLILWVDDEWNPALEETEGNLLLLSARKYVLDALPDLSLYKIDICYTAEEGAALLDQNPHRYDFVIVDYIFQNSRIDMSSVTRAANRYQVPYFVLSNLKPPDTKHDPLLLGAFLKTAESLHQLQKHIQAFLAAPPASLLHLSDIHYTASESQDIMWNELIVYLKTEMSVGQIDGVVITGDIANHHPARDLVQVKPHLCKLVDTLGVDSNNIFIVPGNHDILWDDYENRILAKNPWLYYLNLLRELDIPLPNISNHREIDFGNQDADLFWLREFRNDLEFCGLCTTSTEALAQGRGVLRSTDIRRIRRSWYNNSKNKGRIALMHHNPFPVLSFSDSDELSPLDDSGRVLNSLIDLGCGLVISGHTHSRFVARMHVNVSSQHSSNEITSITSIGGPTMGGFHGDLDREKAFQTITIGPGTPGKIQRSLQLRRFQYNSSQERWWAVETFEHPFMVF